MPIVIVLIELGGGLFMMIGLFVSVVSLGSIAIFGTAIFMLKATKGLADWFELKLLLIVISIIVVFPRLNKKIQLIPSTFLLDYLLK